MNTPPGKGAAVTNFSQVRFRALIALEGHYVRRRDKGCCAWCSGSSRNVVRLPSRMRARLRRNPHFLGKTHLSVALAEAAIQSGCGAYFMTAHDLVTDLGRAYREGRLDRRMRVYLAPKVLIIDEMGYLPLDEMGATIFFQLVSARYERGSIILTSNKSYGDWGSIFGDPIIATAILDRLLHHSTTINIRGESYRLKDRRKAGLFSRAEEQARPAPFPSSEILQNGPRRQGSAAPRQTSAPLTAPGRSGDQS